MPNMQSGVIMLGWREWLGLPDLGIEAIRAKIDTGARSSALHVDDLEVYEAGGRQRVRFILRPGRRATGRRVRCEADVFDRRMVTDSGGHRTERIFIRTGLSIGGDIRQIEINLTNRRNMLFPLLVGRTALAHGVLVDPSRSFTLLRPRRLRWPESR